MDEPVEWLADGAPYNPRFGDRYRSEAGDGLHQARGVFLNGCHLPEAWAGQARWTILETGFGLGLNFLVTWAAWRADPARPRHLHFVSVEAHPVPVEALRRSVDVHPELQPLAEELADQYWSLRPGVHRLRLDGGRVLLTLAIGHAAEVLREVVCTADAVFLDGFSPARNPDIWDLATLKAVVRCCRRGTRLATWTVARPVRDALAQCGFQCRKVEGVKPKRDRLEAVYEPAWTPRHRVQPWHDTEPAPQPGRCIVVGAGLAGAAVARQLAERGWQVQVLDAGAAPAAGASGLPAGLFAPNEAANDTPLAQLSRSGVRCTLATLPRLLQAGHDFHASGVLERRLRDSAAPVASGDRFSRAATAAQCGAAGLPPDEPARWHEAAGWVRPARLVHALLQHPGITFRGGCAIAGLRRVHDTWHLEDADGATLDSATLVVLAAGIGSPPLLRSELGLHPIRGQVSLGACGDGLPVPPWPVNGHGHFIPHVPGDAGPIWLAGSSFHRSEADAGLRDADQGFNLDRLRTLLPATGQALPDGAALQAWGGVRCASRDRLPMVGPVDPAAQPGLWLHTAMGARGLTFALLTAELLVARLHREPLALPARLVAALDPRRHQA